MHGYLIVSNGGVLSSASKSWKFLPHLVRDMSSTKYVYRFTVLQAKRLHNSVTCGFHILLNGLYRIEFHNLFITFPGINKSQEQCQQSRDGETLFYLF